MQDLHDSGVKISPSNGDSADLVARAHAYEPEYAATARSFMSRFLTVARSRAGRRVA